MEKKNEKSVFATLNAINVNEHVEKKDTGKVQLSYLSWAWAWAKVKENYPEASYTIYENKDGWNYHTDGKTCWVKTGVTINGMEHIEYLPVMDNRNRSIPAESVTSFDVNKAIQRSLTKAAARHGLGLYIYAGEDLPEEETKQVKEAAADDLPTAIKEMKACKSRDEINAVWSKWSNKHVEYSNESHEFYKATVEVGQMLQHQQTANNAVKDIEK